MKAYTDIEQSKRLAEILPLESANTIWDLTNPDLPTIRAIPYKDFDYENKYLNIIPAWSLAALLDILPDGTDIVKDKADTENEKYMCTVGIKDDIISTFGKNPVDACVEMVLKLKELKLL